MNPQDTGRWIRVGLWTLPASWLLTAWSSLEPQPDQAADPGAWARFVSTDSYQVSHLIGSTGGTILAVLGLFALGCHLAGSRSGRLAKAAMVTAAAGTALLFACSHLAWFRPGAPQEIPCGVTAPNQLATADIN